jgi:TetR/AcrR family transcriptional regulator
MPKKTPVANRKTDAPRKRAAPDAILSAALDEFAQHGFDGANVSVIAERAGVAKPLVYYHFNDKEALWRSAVGHALTQMTAAFGDIVRDLKDLDPVSRFKVFVRRYAYYAAKNPAVARVIVLELFRGTERAQWLLDNHIASLYQITTQLLRAAQETGQVRDIHPAHLLPIINGSINAFFTDAPFLRQLFGIDALSEEQIQEHADIVVDTIMGGLMVRDSETKTPTATS